MVVAKQIQAVREKRGLSQQKLADMLGMPQSTVARMESGKRVISAAELLRVAYALSVAPVELLAASFHRLPVPIQGTVRLTAEQAHEWIRGERVIPHVDEAAYFENVNPRVYDEEERFQRRVAWRQRARGEVKTAGDALVAEGRAEWKEDDDAS